MAEAYTDVNGLAVFTAPQGTYVVSVNKSGYVSQQIQVSLLGDTLVEVTLTVSSAKNLILPLGATGLGLALIVLLVRE